MYIITLKGRDKKRVRERESKVRERERQKGERGVKVERESRLYKSW